MWFWISMFLCNLLIPLLMIISGYLMYKHTPKKINGVYGYRTTRSMKNMDTWKFAHDYCGQIWMKAGIILLIPTIVIQLPFIHSSDGVIGVMTLLIMTVQLVVLILPVYFVEKALKENFDEAGNRRR
ncbi:MAG: SdpI family protein [Roseburia sp.]